MPTPEIALTHLAGYAGQPALIVGPSLGTRVERLWSQVAGELSDFRVIGWDLPGHGRSAPADGVGHLAPLEDPLATAALLNKHFR